MVTLESFSTRRELGSREKKDTTVWNVGIQSYLRRAPVVAPIPPHQFEKSLCRVCWQHCTSRCTCCNSALFLLLKYLHITLYSAGLPSYRVTGEPVSDRDLLCFTHIQGRLPAGQGPQRCHCNGQGLRSEDRRAAKNARSVSFEEVRTAVDKVCPSLS